MTVEAKLAKGQPTECNFCKGSGSYQASAFARSICLNCRGTVRTPWPAGCEGRVCDTIYDDLGYVVQTQTVLRANVKSLVTIGPPRSKPVKCILEDDDCNGVTRVRDDWAHRHVVDEGAHYDQYRGGNFDGNVYRANVKSQVRP